MFDLFNLSDHPSEEAALDSEFPEPKERIRLSYEDQLYVWGVLIQNNLAGKIAPALKHDRRTKPEYAILIPEHLCLQAFNSVSDIGPITINQLKAAAKTFRFLEPPHPSFPPDSKHYQKGKMRSSTLRQAKLELRNKQSTGHSTY